MLTPVHPSGGGGVHSGQTGHCRVGVALSGRGSIQVDAFLAGPVSRYMPGPVSRYMQRHDM